MLSEICVCLRPIFGCFQCRKLRDVAELSADKTIFYVGSVSRVYMNKS